MSRKAAGGLLVNETNRVWTEKIMVLSGRAMWTL